MTEHLPDQLRIGCYNEKKAESCHLLGEHFEKVKEDFPKSSKLFQSNCDDASYGKSCHMYASYNFIGKGMKENPQEALKYYEKGCSYGFNDSCLYGGIMCVSTSEATKNIEKDYKKGIELLDKACTSENSFACHYLSGIYSVGIKGHVSKNFEKTFECALKACTIGNMYACSNVSVMYNKGEGVEKDTTKSREYKLKYISMQRKAEKEFKPREHK